MRVWQDDISVYVRHGPFCIRPIIHPESVEHSHYLGEVNAYRERVAKIYGGRICHDGTSVFEKGDSVAKKQIPQSSKFEIYSNEVPGKEGIREIWFIDYHTSGEHVTQRNVEQVMEISTKNRNKYIWERPKKERKEFGFDW